MLPGIIPLAGGFPGIDGYTTMMLHCDGANNGTTFPDNSANGITITANGTAKLTTSQSMFGGASATFDGTANCSLSFPTASGCLAFGTGDFTIDFWLRSTGSGAATNGRFFNSTNGTGGVIQVLALDSGSSKLNYYDGTSLYAMSAGSIYDSTWHHFAAARSGTTLKLFLDGAVTNTITGSSNNIAPGATAYIGAYDSGGTINIIGQIDEFRISKGIARWTAAFTPPNRPYV